MADRTELLAAMAQRYDTQTVALMELSTLAAAHCICKEAGQHLEDALIVLPLDDLASLYREWEVVREISNGLLKVSFRRRANVAG